MQRAAKGIKHMLLTQKEKYRFSFTAASLMVEEMVRYARILVEEGLKVDGLSGEMMKRDRLETRRREFAEIRLRLASLSRDEIERLAGASPEDQKYIAVIAFARTYSFFRHFLEEVVCEKVMRFDLQLTDRDYAAFVNRKSRDHDELDALTDRTKAKIKQVTFKALEQAGLIDNVKDRNILIPIVDSGLEKLIARTNPGDLKILLYPEHRIAEL